MDLTHHYDGLGNRLKAQGKSEESVWFLGKLDGLIIDEFKRILGADFDKSSSVVDLGGGTGAFANRLSTSLGLESNII